MLVPSLFYLSLSLSLSLFIRFISPAKSGSLIGTKFFFVVAWKLRGQRGLEHRYRVPDISWLEPPRRTLRRTMLVRGDPTLEDSYLRLVWWFSFVLAGIGQLPAVFYSPGHAYYAAFLLFPFSLLSFPLSLFLFLFISVSIERVDTNKSTRPETLYLRDDVSQVESSLALLVGILTYFSSFLSSFLQFVYRFLSLEESSAITREFLVAVIRPFTSGFIEDDNPGLLEIRSAGPSQRDSNVGYYYPITRDVFIFPVSFSLSRAR